MTYQCSHNVSVGETKYRCPVCGRKEVLRERRPNGDSVCELGHRAPTLAFQKVEVPQVREHPPKRKWIWSDDVSLIRGTISLRDKDGKPSGELTEEEQFIRIAGKVYPLRQIQSLLPVPEHCLNIESEISVEYS